MPRELDSIISTIEVYMGECLKLSKLDVARRQLETAILLYFNEADPVSIHTLAAAAHDILQPLSLRSRRPTFLEQSLAILPQAFREKIRKEVRRPQNFFKHADRDPEDSIDFIPGLTEWTLIDAVAKYVELTGDESPMFRAYFIWFATRDPELWKHTAQGDLIQRARKEVCSMSRKAFFLFHFKSSSLVLLEATPNQRLQRTAGAAR